MGVEAENKSLRRKLGRGLGSLISAPVRVDISPQAVQESLSTAPAGITGGHAAVPESPDSTPAIRLIPIAEIHRNPQQPRQDFDAEALEHLASSIRQSGLMQPIIVRPRRPAASAATGRGVTGYEIIAGERRWRAAQLVGLKAIPAIIRDLNDQQTAEFALVENLQREDLNPIERAEAFARLISEFQLTHQEIAQRIGLERSSVTNHLRLNELNSDIKASIRAGALSMGHAKALLVITNLQERDAIAASAIRQQWSVREIEQRVRQWQEGAGTPGGSSGPAARASSSSGGTGNGVGVGKAHPHMADLERRLGEHLGTKVALKTGRTKGSGKLTIDFYSLDQFEGLMQRLGFEAD